MTGPIGPGAVVAVVGASGVGKDALIDQARARTDGSVVFPRRVVTRPPGPGEDHEPLDPDAFAEACSAGAFAVWWRAHGLGYGLPSAVDDDVRAGRVVVANVSRSVLAALAERYERVVVVRVTVSDAVRAERLRGRRRESAEQIVARMARADPAPDRHADVVIDNDGPLERAGDELVAVVRAAARTT